MCLRGSWKLQPRTTPACRKQHVKHTSTRAPHRHERARLREARKHRFTNRGNANLAAIRWVESDSSLPRRGDKRAEALGDLWFDPLRP